VKVVLPELQKINTDVFINLRDRTENIIISANRGDAHSRTIRFNFIYEDELYEIPEGIIARFMGTRPDGCAIIEEEPCIIEGNQVLYEMTPYILNISGDVRAKIELRNEETEQILTTVAFTIHIPKDPFDENAIIKTDEFSILNALIEKVEEALENVDEALVQVEDKIQEADEAIQEIHTTNEQMKEVITEANTVIDSMNDKLQEADTVIDEMGEKLIEADNKIAELDDLHDDINVAIKNAETATTAANKATEDSNAAAERADDAAQRANAAAKAAEDIVTNGIPVATTTILGGVKASEQIHVAEDGTMSILSVPKEALPEDIGKGGLEQYALFSSLPSQGNESILYIVTGDSDDKNGMYYWNIATSSYQQIEAGSAGSIVVDITWEAYQAIPEDEKNNGVIYNIIDENETDIENVSNSVVRDITFAEYQALSDEEKKNGTIYNIVDEDENNTYRSDQKLPLSLSVEKWTEENREEMREIGIAFCNSYSTNIAYSNISYVTAIVEITSRIAAQTSGMLDILEYEEGENGFLIIKFFAEKIPTTEIQVCVFIHY